METSPTDTKPPRREYWLVNTPGGHRVAILHRAFTKADVRLITAFLKHVLIDYEGGDQRIEIHSIALDPAPRKSKTEGSKSSRKKSA